jgi:hypothetical protein
VEADEVIRQLGKSLVVSLGVAVLEAKVLALDIPEIIESLSKRVDGRPGLDRQDTDRDYFPSRLLRARRERHAATETAVTLVLINLIAAIKAWRFGVASANAVKSSWPPAHGGGLCEV